MMCCLGTAILFSSKSAQSTTSDVIIMLYATEIFEHRFNVKVFVSIYWEKSELYRRMLLLEKLKQVFVAHFNQIC